MGDDHTACHRFPREPGGGLAGNIVNVRPEDRPRFGPVVLPHEGRASRPTVLILGAGYTGVSAALRLAELNQAAGAPLRIVLAEAGQVGCGPSGKSAGHVCGLQASDERVLQHCGPELGTRLLQAAEAASDLVRRLVHQHAIPCDLQDGYLLISSQGGQERSSGKHLFGVAPYPYLLGLAFAAEAAGAEILEHSPVTRIEEAGTGLIATLGTREIPAEAVIAAGGHGMAERIGFLRPLRRWTTELRVSTLITEPLDPGVLSSIMPGADDRRLPFANDASNVAYGSIDRSRRMIFGACATAIRDPSFDAIVRMLHLVFPTLAQEQRRASGRALRWHPLVDAERICFTRIALPNVGALGATGRVFYAHAFGGHGLALATLLGRAVAEKTWSSVVGTGGDPALFDEFASIPKFWLPSWTPARGLAAAIGLQRG